MLFCSLLAHQLTMFLVQIHNISALLLVYITKMGSLLLLLNNHFETKFKGRDKTQSTPQKKKKTLASVLSSVVIIVKVSRISSVVFLHAKLLSYRFLPSLLHAVWIYPRIDVAEHAHLFFNPIYREFEQSRF